MILLSDGSNHLLVDGLWTWPVSYNRALSGDSYSEHSQRRTDKSDMPVMLYSSSKRHWDQWRDLMVMLVYLYDDLHQVLSAYLAWCIGLHVNLCSGSGIGSR